MESNHRFKKGHKHSPEVLEKIRLANTGRKHTPEEIAKRVASRKGYRHSEETKEKIRQANLGKKPSPETIEKFRQRMIGREPWNKGKKYAKYTREEILKKWLESNPERRIEQARRSHLKRKFGITLEEYENMVKIQHGRCAICGESPKETVDKRGRKKSNLYIDHCHDTLKVRGLLCQSCNTGLGYFKDEPEYLNSAATYLKRFIKKMPQEN